MVVEGGAAGGAGASASTGGVCSVCGHVCGVAVAVVVVVIVVVVEVGCGGGGVGVWVRGVVVGGRRAGIHGVRAGRVVCVGGHGSVPRSVVWVRYGDRPRIGG